MVAADFFAFYPKRILWSGMILIGGICCLAASLAFCSVPFLREGDVFVKKSQNLDENLDFSLYLTSNSKWECPFPAINGQLSFFLNPSRPESIEKGLRVFVRAKQQPECRNYPIPCRVYLAFQDNGALALESGATPFYLEVDEQFQATTYIDGRQGDSFLITPEEKQPQSFQSFKEGSPFRILAEGRWWGHNLLEERFGSKKIVHRIELGPLLNADLLEAPEGGWIVFKEGKWKGVDAFPDEMDLPLARIRSAGVDRLELEGWEGQEYIRLDLSTASNTPFKIKSEEVFTAIRVRSDRQISCMIDKQCLILKTGDWVLKTNSKWKILRKAEEKAAFLSGKIAGDLFVLDQIVNRQGQKSIIGQMYNAGRTQVFKVELPVSARIKAEGKSLEGSSGKGKGKNR